MAQLCGLRGIVCIFRGSRHRLATTVPVRDSNPEAPRDQHAPDLWRRLLPDTASAQLDRGA